MKIGKVINNVWATRKDDSLVGQKFLIVQLMNKNAEFKGSIIVAADYISAGVGDKVLVTQGSSSQNMQGLKNSPIDAIIVGIIDEEIEES